MTRNTPQAVRTASPAAAEPVRTAGKGVAAIAVSGGVSEAYRGDVIRVTLPWSPCAVPDNAAYRAVAGRVLLSKRGREAKAATFGRAFEVTRGRLLSGPLALTCIGFPPDARVRDVGNLRKLVTDALQGAVYGNDAQLIDERWTLGPIDRSAPRLEITVGPAAATARGRV